MDKTPDPSSYDAFYFEHYCGQPYHRRDLWIGFFGSIADRIVSDINPRSVLDAGCAFGYLVEKLREHGVEAWGLDISEYAIQNVHPSAKPYCWVGSITDPFPKKYDLIVSIEVFEHIPTRDSAKAIANLCQFSDDILFSSTPFDFNESTHVNVQQPEYWAQQFARHGFYRDLDFDASFITSWAARFRRSNEPIHRLAQNYERKFWLVWKENVDQRHKMMILTEQLKQSEQNREILENQKTEYEQHLKDLESQVVEHEQRWKDAESGAGWRFLITLSKLRLFLAPRGSRRERWFNSIFKSKS